MRPERLGALAHIFRCILEQPELRDSILDAECGDDGAMRADLEKLLDADDDATGFLEAPPGRPGIERELAGRQLGVYRVGELIGRGGMGSVHRAVRIDAQFEQEVAIKFLSPTVRSRTLVARFHRERQILARLSHPHIARLFDGGTTDDGLPYLVMELVTGAPITDFCVRNKLHLDQRLNLFCRVAAAVEAAHRSLIIHRDLKPSNILVDEHGEPKLLDFGLAKSLEEDAETAPNVPWFAIMTPRYASPEQLRGEPLTVATDVYSLGLVLYELLVGQPPKRPETGSDSATDRSVASPTAPSTAASRLGLRESIHEDLDTIVLKAIAGATSERYGSVGELLEDLDRFLHQMPIRARRPTLAYRTARFIDRNRIGVAVTVTLLAAISGLAVLLALQARETRGQRDRARETLNFVTELFTVSNPNEALGDTPTARSLLKNGVRRIEQLYSGRPEVHGDLVDTLGRIHGRFGLAETAKDLLERGQAIRRYNGLPAEERVEGLLALADVHQQLDRYADARTNLDEARTILAGGASRLPELTVRATSMEFNLLKAEAQPAEARVAAQRAMELSRQLLGDAHDDTIASLGNLAAAELALGHSVRAKELLSEATQLAESRKAPYPHLYDLLFRRAQLARAAGQYSEAIDLSRRSLEEARRFHDDQHPYIGRLRDHLADSLLSAGQYEKAIAIYRQHLPGDPALFTRSHGAVFTDLASALSRSGRPEEAQEAFEQAIELFLEHYGEQHPRTLAARFGLASLLHRVGELSAAEDLYDLCLRHIEVLDGTPPAGYPRTGFSWLLLELGEAERGLALAEEALDRIRQTHPEGHWRRAWAGAALGAARSAVGRQAEGEIAVRIAVDSLNRALGSDDDRVVRTVERLQRLGLAIEQATPEKPD
ncbi:MAG: serine/threonine-protein kinase [Acidobacteriota bacterium]